MRDILDVDITSPTYLSDWGPVIDKRSVLPSDVRTLIERGQGRFGSTDVLVGVVKNEGFLFFTNDELTNGLTSLRKQRRLENLRHKTLSFDATLRTGYNSDGVDLIAAKKQVLAQKRHLRTTETAASDTEHVCARVNCVA